MNKVWPGDPFITALAKLAQAEWQTEKLLLSPSVRVGRQWIDQATRIAGAILNLRPITLERLLRDLAQPEQTEKDLRYPGEVERLEILREVFQAAREAKTGYYSRLSPNLSVLRSLDATLAHLLRAGVDERRVMAKLPGSAKKKELAFLLRNYREALAKQGFTDPAGVLAAARERLSSLSSQLPLLLVGADWQAALDHRGQEILKAWPTPRKRLLPSAAGEKSPSVHFGVADGALNEAREIFRRLYREKIPLDQAEVVTAGSAGAGFIILAAGEFFANSDGEAPPPGELPLTLAEGIPGSFSHPLRLLQAWLAWLAAGAFPADLAGLTPLFSPKRLEKGNVSPERLAKLLRSLPAAAGAKEILSALENPPSLGEGGDKAAHWGDSDPASRDMLVAFGQEVLSHLEEGATGVLAASRILLLEWGRYAGELDAYVLRALKDDPFFRGDLVPWEDFNPLDWLGRLGEGMRVLGRGPLPGKLFVSGRSGGQSGRPHLLVTGLTENVFPGGAEDPLLPDRERQVLASALPLASQERLRREEWLGRLLARSGAKSLFLSYSRFDLSQGRESFPSPWLTTHRGEAGLDNAPLLPSSPADLWSGRDYWLDQELSAPWVDLAQVTEVFPDLARGEAGRLARASNQLSAYDGGVAAAGTDYLSDTPVLSASQLECLARCPQEYFFRYVLRVRPPDRYQPLDNRWLDYLAQGRFLHQVFQDFLEGLQQKGERADLQRHRPLMDEVIEKQIGFYSLLYPRRDPLVFNREVAYLKETGESFLQMEVELQRHCQPLAFEFSFGKGQDPGPQSIPLPSGRPLLLGGRLDRLDLLDRGGVFIWDYKTGRSGDYLKQDIFAGGSNLQPALYALAYRGLGREPVAGAGYYFPTPRGGGRRISHSYPELELAIPLLDWLTALLAAGKFPFLTLPKYRLADYSPIFRAVGGEKKLEREAAAKGMLARP
ncbi:MAG: PD-(D/E)XK nuclease family protein [Planctomycetota bacterium]|jgi:ATP-dependent helicase/nuclease subunit B|nr:PD-(D/E)XK nuclease family protein [Planctomycetota bacterium]